MEREEQINKLIQLSCNKKRYHYMTVILCLIMAINMNIFNVCIIYLKRKSSDGINYPYSIPCVFNVSSSGILAAFGAFPYIGNYVFGLIFSPLTEYLGHKLSIFVGGASYIVFLSLCVLVYNYWVIYFFLILSQISSNVMLYSSLFLGQELASSRQRALIGSIINTGFCLSGLLHLLFFYCRLSYKVIFAIDICFTSGLLIPFNYWIYDSPRYYLEHNQIEEGLTILEKISDFNHDKELFQQSIQKKEYKKIIKSLKGTQDEDEIDMTKTNEEVITYSLCTIFKYRSIYKPVIILSTIWFCTGFIYNSIAFILEWEDKFIFELTALIFCIEGVAYFSIGQLINIRFFGRKRTTYSLFFLTFIFFIIMLILNKTTPPKQIGQESNDMTLFSIFVAASRFTFSGIFTILYTYSPECYPKGFKTGCFGINVLSAALGSASMALCSEFIFQQWKDMFYYIGGTMAFVCGFIAFFLEETRDQPFMSEIKEIRDRKEKERLEEERRRIKREKIQKLSQSEDMLLP